MCDPGAALPVLVPEADLPARIARGVAFGTIMWRLRGDYRYVFRRRLWRGAGQYRTQQTTRSETYFRDPRPQYVASGLIVLSHLTSFDVSADSCVEETC